MLFTGDPYSAISPLIKGLWAPGFFLAGVMSYVLKVSHACTTYTDGGCMLPHKVNGREGGLKHVVTSGVALLRGWLERLQG